MTAVELNGQIADLVRDEYAGFSGGIFRNERVDLRIAEARDFVTRDRRHYDLIQMTALDAFGASASGLRALNESYLYTVEALRAYLERLNPGGLVAITRWIDLPPRDGIKLFVTALEASGVEGPGQRLAWIRGWSSNTLIVKNGELTGEQIAALRGDGSGDTTWSRGVLLGYFLFIGLAFLFIEIAFIQIFMRFLGHPVYSVTVVLASFLLFAAAGSRLTEVREESMSDGRKLAMAVAAIVTICVLYCASVVSAVLAVVLAMHFGFTAVILGAAALYVLAGLIGRRDGHPPPDRRPSTYRREARI